MCSNIFSIFIKFDIILQVSLVEYLKISYFKSDQNILFMIFPLLTSQFCRIELDPIKILKILYETSSLMSHNIVSHLL